MASRHIMNWMMIAVGLALVLSSDARAQIDPALDANGRVLAQEEIPADEQADFETMLEILKEGYAKQRVKPGQMAHKFTNAKEYGCALGKFEIMPGIPDSLKAGLFANPPGTSWSTWVHFTNGIGGPRRSDVIPDARTLGIKLLDVPGDKLLDDEKTVVDFTFSSAKLFVSATVKEHIARTRLIGNELRALRPGSGVTFRGASIISNPLNVTYYSSIPQLMGPRRAAKFKMVPCDPPIAMEKKIKPSWYGKYLHRNYLSQMFKKQITRHGACYMMYAQEQVDALEQPIENARHDWSEALSPYVPVARVVMEPQWDDTAERKRFCQDMTFNPWHTIAEHRPLGGLNRLRKFFYSESARIRREMTEAAR